LLEEPAQLSRLQRPHPDGIPERRREPEAPEGSLELEVEAHVPVGAGEEGNGPLNRVVDRPRNEPPIPSRQAERPEGVVAGEQLVAAVSPQGHGHPASCLAAQQVRREDRRIADGLVKASGDLRQEPSPFFEGKNAEVELHSQPVGEHPRVPGFVETRLLEADGDRLDAAGKAGGVGGHGRRVDPAAEKEPQRHVRDHPALHRPRQKLVDPLAVLGFGILAGGLLRLES